MPLRIDLDPSLVRVCVIGVLTFLEVFLGALLVILQKEQYPTVLQLVTILVVSLLTLVTYFSTFLKKEEATEEETKA